MRASRMLGGLLLALVLCPAVGRAAPIHSIPLSKALRALDSPVVPAEWAGVWSTSDTTRDCGSPTIKNVSTNLDTLCTGSSFGPDTTQYSCSGSTSANSYDITCSYTFEIITGCSVTINDHLQGSRVGNVVHSTSTMTTTFTPPNCALQPDGCTVTTGVMTMIGPEPADCAMTPVRTGSWGRLKLLYR